MGTQVVKLLVSVTLFSLAVAQPFLPAQPAVVPLGNFRTNDGGTPQGYNLTLLPTQAAFVSAAIAQKQNFTDKALIDFLASYKCLSANLGTWGVFGSAFNDDLGLGGAVPVGVRQANLTQDLLPFLQEIALDQQGALLWTRHTGSNLSCPSTDFLNGFNCLLAVAYNLTSGNATTNGLQTNSTAFGTVPGGVNCSAIITRSFGSFFDPFASDDNFLLSMLTVESLGATLTQGLVDMMSNPVFVQGVAGMTGASAAHEATLRQIIWNRRGEGIQPFNQSLQTVMSTLSAAQDALDGPQVDEQGIIQTDRRFIAVPTAAPNQYINIVPTDIHGLTFARTPQQVLRVLTAGSPTSLGGFFPSGTGTPINDTSGYADLDPAGGLGNWPMGVASPGSTQAVGIIQLPINATGAVLQPADVTDDVILQQAVSAPYDNGTASTRGFPPGAAPAQAVNFVGPGAARVQFALEAGPPTTSAEAAPPPSASVTPPATGVAGGGGAPAATPTSAPAGAPEAAPAGGAAAGAAGGGGGPVAAPSTAPAAAPEAAPAGGAAAGGATTPPAPPPATPPAPTPGIGTGG